MKERERLVELINKGERLMWGKSVGGIKGQREALADYLLDSGIIVPPVKVGDIVYVTPYIWECDSISPKTSLIIAEVIGIVKTKYQTFMELKANSKNFGMHKYNRFVVSAIGKTVFLTKESAGKALKGANR